MANTPAQVQAKIDQARLAAAVDYVTIAADLSTVQGQVTTLENAMTAVEGDVLNLTNDLTTLDALLSPSLAAFTPDTGVVISTLTTSAAVALSGAAAGLYPLLVLGNGSPEIDINSDGVWATERFARNGDTIRARLTSSPNPATEFVATVYYPNGNQPYSVTTAP